LKEGEKEGRTSVKERDDIRVEGLFTKDRGRVREGRGKKRGVRTESERKSQVPAA